MIDKLLELFQTKVEEQSDDPQALLRVATAALMFEVARSDNDKAEVEMQKMSLLLAERFGLAEADNNALLQAAADQVEVAHDLYQFTQVINDTFDYEAKRALVHNLWQVAFADGHADAMEDHIIRRIAGLLHIAHGDFIQEKIKARDS